jgi:L-lactate dehydrogenase complex protein LldG
MNIEEVLALRKAFNSVKDRQSKNPMNNFEERKKRLKAAREQCTGNQELLKKTIKKLENNGFKVYLAREKQEAIDFILKEIAESKLVVKSKSNVTKELELTKALEANGIQVIETDIGDRILQVLHLQPSHPTGPIAHVSAKSISRQYGELGIKLGDKPEEIVSYVREEVINKLNKASIGITGANAITTEEGSVVMTHNEGNIFEVMRRKKHIIVTSIDKVYPSLEDAMNMLKILSYNATGATIPSFVEVLSGVSKTADVEKKFYKGVYNPHDVTVVLVDNKRSELANNGLKELLYCIGCGNCLIHCPMYNTIGTDYAKDNYLGGKGLAYYSLAIGGNEKLDLCLSCNKCKESCPLGIDIPNIIRDIRSKGISDEIYYFLKSHIFWIYYNLMIKLNRSLM